MPTIAEHLSSPIPGGKKPGGIVVTDAVGSEQIPSSQVSTPRKRTLRSSSAQQDNFTSPLKYKSPRRRPADSPNSVSKGLGMNSRDTQVKSSKSLGKKRLLACFNDKPIWNPKDVDQLNKIKAALHVSTVPSAIVCRENEQRRILEFCKHCVQNDKAGSLYVCGCPGTGKSLSMGKVKEAVVDWAQVAGFQPPEVLEINCTSFVNTSEIFSKILEIVQPRKKNNRHTSPLQHLQNLYSQKQSSPSMKMMLVIADELDYLITKDRAILHDLFMLTTFPFSRCILIGIANAIDLADRFLPKLQALNCKAVVVTFRAYSKDQIIMILQQRLMELPYAVFQPQALELCARKVSAASGDMRNALSVCRSAIEMLEAEIEESTFTHNLSLSERLSEQTADAFEINIVRVDHVAVALSKAYKFPVVDTIQSLPQHQQIILCSAVKLFRMGKKDTTLGELNKAYVDMCKSTIIPPVGIMELSSMCRVLGDQGLFKLGQSRDDRMRRLTLKVDVADINFALQGIRFFRNCLQ